MMKYEKSFAPCQGYRGWADVEAIEYKYPRKKPLKCVLRITLVDSTPKIWREFAVLSSRNCAE